MVLLEFLYKYMSFNYGRNVILELYMRFYILLVPIVCLYFRKLGRVHAVSHKNSHVCRRVQQLFTTLCSFINSSSIYKVNSVFIKTDFLSQ